MRPGSGLLQPDHDVHEGSRFLAIPVDRQHTCHPDIMLKHGAPRAWRGTSATASFQQDDRMAGGTESPGRLTGFGWRTGNGTRRGGRGTGSGRRTSDHTRCKLTWPNGVTPPVLLKNPDLLFSSPSGPGTPPVLLKNPVLLFFPPAPTQREDGGRIIVPQDPFGRKSMRAHI